MWAVLALMSTDRPDPSTRLAIKRATGFLGDTKPGQTNESLMVSLLVARKLGRAQEADRLLVEVLSRQNVDGGWSWRRGAKSDAFATGQALYALREAGLAAGHAAIRRAREYLVRTQQEDGSWLVPPRAISSAQDPNRLSRLAPIYRYWGTGWASIGLSTAMPAPRVGKLAEGQHGLRGL